MTVYARVKAFCVIGYSELKMLLKITLYIFKKNSTILPQVIYTLDYLRVDVYAVYLLPAQLACARRLYIKLLSVNMS